MRDREESCLDRVRLEVGTENDESDRRWHFCPTHGREDLQRKESELGTISTAMSCVQDLDTAGSTSADGAWHGVLSTMPTPLLSKGARRCAQYRRCRDASSRCSQRNGGRLAVCRGEHAAASVKRGAGLGMHCLVSGPLCVSVSGGGRRHEARTARHRRERVAARSCPLHMSKNAQRLGEFL